MANHMKTQQAPADAEKIADILNWEAADAVLNGDEAEEEVFHYWANANGTITVADFDGLVIGVLGANEARSDRARADFIAHRISM